MPRCCYVKPDGKQYAATALPKERHCVFHSRATAAKTAAGRKAGGEKRAGSLRPATLPEGTPPLRLESVADVTAALAETFNHVRVGRLAVPVGNALAVIAQGLLKSLEKAEWERRFEALEAALSRGGAAR